MSTELLNRITSNTRQCGGRPCIRGMRIRVKDVLDMLAGGASDEEILADFPYLEPDDIRPSLRIRGRSNRSRGRHDPVVNFLVEAQQLSIIYKESRFAEGQLWIHLSRNDPPPLPI